MSVVQSRSELAALLQTAVAERLDVEVKEAGDLSLFFAGGDAVGQLTEEVRRYGYDVAHGYVTGGIQNYAWMGDQSHRAHITLVRIPRRPPPPPPAPTVIENNLFVYAARYHDPAVNNSTWLTVSGMSREEALAKAMRRVPPDRLLTALHREDDQLKVVWDDGHWLPLAFEPHLWTNVRDQLRFGDIAVGECFYNAGGFGSQLEKVDGTHGKHTDGSDTLTEFDPYAVIARKARSWP